jgi:demethoxyubiquinone hydroxylase (CLK1/Coq7/Cat5 family)
LIVKDPGTDYRRSANESILDHPSIFPAGLGEDLRVSPAVPSTSEPASPVCVYYDGGCPLCRAEIATYQRADGGDSVRWVDAHGCAAAELGPDLEVSRALARLHVRRADGTLVEGAAAFAEIWQALPRWRWLAGLARLPMVMPLLDHGYDAFLKVRPLWRPTAEAAKLLPRSLLRELRTDHAGETGAVMIYRGILAVTRDQTLRAFAHHHLETERRHLASIEEIVPSRWRSVLLPLWRLSGWLTGALPAFVGPRAVYATVEAVETFVDRHYALQIESIDVLLGQPPSVEADARTTRQTQEFLQRLRALLVVCRADEVAHRDEAAAAQGSHPSGIVLRAWCGLVGLGSRAAVAVCRYL